MHMHMCCVCVHMQGTKEALELELQALAGCLACYVVCTGVSTLVMTVVQCFF